MTEKRHWKGKVGLPLYCFLSKFIYIIFNFSTCGLNFYVLQRKFLPLCRQSIKLICSILLLINEEKIYQIKLQESIYIKSGMVSKEVKSPDDVSFHDSLFQSFESVHELISAICTDKCKWIIRAWTWYQVPSNPFFNETNICLHKKVKLRHVICK